MYTATRQVRSKLVVAQHQIPQRVVEILLRGRREVHN